MTGAFASIKSGHDNLSLDFVSLGAAGGFIVGTPIVHAANVQFLTSLGSLAMRFAMVYVGFVAGGSLGV
jgi:hypothetical protein